MPQIVAQTDGLVRQEDFSRFADSLFEVRGRRPPFLHGSSVVDVHPRPHQALACLVDSADFGNSFWHTVWSVQDTGADVFDDTNSSADLLGRGCLAADVEAHQHAAGVKGGTREGGAIPRFIWP
jgi:hypothetical protein